VGIFDWFRKRAAPASKPPHEAEDEPDAPDEPDEPDEPDVPDATAPELTDELDLHTFQPRDCADLVDEYLHAARDAGFATVRIIHGKGKGTLRRIVHGVLEKHPTVRGFRLGDQRSGSWGATIVDLAPKE